MEQQNAVAVLLDGTGGAQLGEPGAGVLPGGADALPVQLAQGQDHAAQAFGQALQVPGDLGHPVVFAEPLVLGGEQAQIVHDHHLGPHVPGLELQFRHGERGHGGDLQLVRIELAAGIGNGGILFLGCLAEQQLPEGARDIRNGGNPAGI